MLFSSKKKWTTNTYYSMAKSKIHYAKCKKPNSKEYILYNSIYMQSPEKVSL